MTSKVMENSIFGEYVELSNPDKEKIKDLLSNAYKTDSIAKNKWRIENRQMLREQSKKTLKKLMKKKRIPRKIKKQIPKNTPYCYQIDNKKQRKEKGFVFHIKTCGFYKHTESILGHCKFLNCEVEDQCKSCGLRY